MKKKTALISTAAVVGVMALAVIVWVVYAFVWPGQGDENPTTEEDVEEAVPVSADVSSETMDRLSNGTILSFGSDSAKQISLIVDPEDLSREKPFIDGRPSDILTAVNEGKVGLNLYLVPSSNTREEGVNSIIRAATCRIAHDPTDTAIFTLNGIVNAADSVQSIENVEQAAEIMGMSEDTTCPPDSNNVASSTMNNAQHFMNHFNMDSPGVMISGGGITDDIMNVNDAWVQGAINGEDARQLVN